MDAWINRRAGTVRATRHSLRRTDLAFENDSEMTLSVANCDERFDFLNPMLPSKAGRYVIFLHDNSGGWGGVRRGGWGGKLGRACRDPALSHIVDVRDVHNRIVPTMVDIDPPRHALPNPAASSSLVRPIPNRTLHTLPTPPCKRCCELLVKALAAAPFDAGEEPRHGNVRLAAGHNWPREGLERPRKRPREGTTEWPTHGAYLTEHLTTSSPRRSWSRVYSDSRSRQIPPTMTSGPTGTVQVQGIVYTCRPYKQYM